MFKNLQKTITELNSNVNDVANCEKAKKLRKKLISIGLPIAIIGFLGVFTCFVLFATAGMSGFAENGFSARLIVPFVLFMPCGIMGGIGAVVSSLGFKIVITGYATNLVDETVGNKCPSCGEKVEDALFCGKCGAKIKKQCNSCKHINKIENEFCEICGNKLD